jgi:hypothetical protein
MEDEKVVVMNTVQVQPAVPFPVTAHDTLPVSGNISAEVSKIPMVFYDYKVFHAEGGRPLTQAPEEFISFNNERFITVGGGGLIQTRIAKSLQEWHNNGWELHYFDPSLSFMIILRKAHF